MKSKEKNIEKSNTIALLAPFFYIPFVSEVVDGIENKLVGTKYSPCQFSTKGILENERNILEKILKLNTADAFILFNIPVDDDIRKEMKKRKIPVVSLEMEIKGFTCITSDNFKGAYLGTDYLIKKGRKKIALVAGKRFIPDIQNERIKGYMSALDNNKIEFKDEFIKVITRHNYEDGIEISKEFYKNKNLYDAIFCIQGDVVAAGIIKGLQNNNIKVPDEIAVVGYDDLKIASFITPQLTTIRQHTKKMGEMAVELILDVLENKKKKMEKKIIIAPELIIRESA